jgi:hypothetical protein
MRGLKIVIQMDSRVALALISVLGAIIAIIGRWLLAK